MIERAEINLVSLQSWDLNIGKHHFEECYFRHKYQNSASEFLILHFKITVTSVSFFGDKV